MGIIRHLQHVRTSKVAYCRIRKVDIPDGATVTVLDRLPESPDVNSPMYVQISNNWYYQLCGKKPDINVLKYGEIGISFAKGFERIYIQNSENEIVEFMPSTHEKNFVYNAIFTNPDLPLVDGNKCIWAIKYEDLQLNSISPNGAVVTIREIATGKQIVPDVQFDDRAEVVKITFYATSSWRANMFKAIIMGNKYNN